MYKGEKENIMMGEIQKNGNVLKDGLEGRDSWDGMRRKSKKEKKSISFE